MWFHKEMNSKFYVDSNYNKTTLSCNDTKMETEVKSLKQDLNRTQLDLKKATKRCRELVKELNTLTTCHQSERNLRDQQLSKILRALLVLESRLRQEQKSLRQQLSEKDNVIRTQQMEIAKLRRQTKNYIKINKREQSTSIEPGDYYHEKNDDTGLLSRLEESQLGNYIHRLKRELYNKMGSYDSIKNYSKEFGVKKTDSFAGSDVSKESLGSENTDASILTTTTEGSPSVLSTEGFCEGESTDVSPGSTLNKSTRRKNSDSENEACTTQLNDNDDDKYSQRRIGILRTEPLEIFNNQISKISRSDSKDDGMDCNFISEEEEEEEDDAEPIYVNACNDNNTRNVEDSDCKVFEDNNKFNNNNNRQLELQPQDKSLEETSGNWYSDPDEDRITDEVFRHNTYRPKSSNHNSVLECVNQILLRDMEEEENNVLSISRKFKHRGRIVSFQPARLSDIESVGSEMERRNSEEVSGDKDTSVGGSESGIDEEIDTESTTLARAIPIVIIEPEIDEDNNNNNHNVVPVSPSHSLKSSNSSTSLMRLESIEEKTCMSMSTKGLTLVKNLDYEDIESLGPDVMPPQPPRTPPALPPKPQFRNNTLILKEIPSPSFLIDESKNKNSPRREASGYARKFYQSNTPIRPISASVRSLFIRKKPSNNVDNGNLNDTKRKLSLDLLNKNVFETKSPPPRVTNIVRHFEEFKIGGDNEVRVKAKDRKVIPELEEIDIRENFEEFNLDDCDLSDDPDRLDGDGSDKLVGNSITAVNHLDNDSSSTTVKSNGATVDNEILNSENNNPSGIYDHFLEATGLSTKSILTPSRLISNHKSMLKPKDIKYKNKIKSNSMGDRSGGYTTTTTSGGTSQTHVRHWTGPFV